MHRYLEKQVKTDLTKKMVFIGGARQVGKTTLVNHILNGRPGYLNWDIPADRSRILNQELPEAEIWAFDEIHKYQRWRDYLKGIYDSQIARNTQQKILITGSARLDYYRFSGDSLQGRYHYLRLHPLSAAELGLNSAEQLNDLLTLGGFPEPYLSGSEVEARRWSREYKTRLIEEEIRSIEQLKDLGSLELMAHRLAELVGSPLSINALREDLQVSHKTASKWLDVLERFYAIFRLPPFGAPAIRAVKKSQKLYQTDWSVVKNQGARLENLVACHLLKWIHFQQDVFGRDVELHYFRDLEDREVDFVVTEDRRPIQAVEVKLSQAAISKSLTYFTKKFPDCQSYQIHLNGDKSFVNPLGIRVGSVLDFLQTLV
jgi:uncharacterized protein